jgi:DNA (cytosine-5)-methyltransferase 1
MPASLVKAGNQEARSPDSGSSSQASSSAIPFLDLFAGAGGLSMGLAEAGFAPVRAVEIMEDAAQSYERWHDIDVDRRRLEEIPDRELKAWGRSVQLVVGGPPCQPWSTGGLRLAEKDSRDGFPAMLRALRVIQPDAFLIENVAGIERGATRAYFCDLIRTLEGLSYEVSSKTLDAADFGVPQHRHRTFIVGSRLKKLNFPAPSHGPEGVLPWVSAGSVITTGPQGEPNPSIVSYAKRPHLRPSPYDGLLFNGGGRPIDLSRPARTILASAGGNKTQFIDTEGVVPEYHALLWDEEAGKPRPTYEQHVRSGKVPGARRITVQESGRLQSFPDEMVFCGTRSMQYTLVGNAVPPRLAAAVGKAVKSLLINDRP